MMWCQFFVEDWAGGTSSNGWYGFKKIFIHFFFSLSRVLSVVAVVKMDSEKIAMEIASNYKYAKENLEVPRILALCTLSVNHLHRELNAK